MEEKNVEIVEENIVNSKEENKKKLKEGIKMAVSELVSSVVLAFFLISGLGQAVEAMKVRKDGETKWWKIIIYTVLIAVLSGVVAFATQYSSDLTQFIVNLFNW